MTRTEIIELATVLSERKFEKYNTPALYKFVVQDICKRESYWWRRVQVNFSMTINQPTYDLTNIALFPGLTEITLEQITKFTIITSPNPLQTLELVPVFDPESLIEMQNNVTTQQPGRYTMDANSSSIIRIDPPDNAYNSYIVGWGMPNPPTDDASDIVPLIPPWGHNTIVSGLVAKVFKFAYGSKNEKTTDAVAEYEQGIQDLAQRKKFDPNFKLQLTLNEHAVRSTD